jgi:hypothetical protein
LVALVSTVGLGIGGSAVASAQEAHPIVQFASMSTVTTDVVRTVNDKSIVAGGKAWPLTAGTGELDSDGTARFRHGLIIPVAPFNRTNPSRASERRVSSITSHHAMVKVFPATFPTTSAGDANIDARSAAASVQASGGLRDRSDGRLVCALSIPLDDEGADEQTYAPSFVGCISSRCRTIGPILQNYSG